MGLNSVTQTSPDMFYQEGRGRIPEDRTVKARYDSYYEHQLLGSGGLIELAGVQEELQKRGRAHTIFKEVENLVRRVSYLYSDLSLGLGLSLKLEA
jgi:hypothetical protein